MVNYPISFDVSHNNVLEINMNDNRVIYTIDGFVYFPKPDVALSKNLINKIPYPKVTSSIKMTNNKISMVIVKKKMVIETYDRLKIS